MPNRFHDRAFDPETVLILQAAFQDACKELGAASPADPLCKLVADALLTLAHSGEEPATK